MVGDVVAIEYCDESAISSIKTDHMFHIFARDALRIIYNVIHFHQNVGY